MQLTQEITQIINTLPKEFLGKVLQYLQQLEKTSQEKTQLSTNLKTILTEDKELLERLR